MRVIRCDRCGAEVTEEKPKGTGVFSFAAGGPLPREWRRVAFPEPDGSAWGRELCPSCVNALRMFLEGDGAVPGLLEADALAMAERCSCPKPQAPVPPCPVHAADPEDEPEPQHEKAPEEDDGGREHEHMFDRMHGLCRCGSTYEDVLARTKALNAPPVLEHDTPECPYCPLRGFQYTAMHIREVHPDLWEGWCDDQDPRPNLTARAAKLASGNIRVGSMTAPCPEGDGRCSGLYERGQLHEHMSRCHGIIVARKTRQCPYCTDLYDYMTQLGPHIAKEHPGEWQAWIDGGQKPG